MPIYEYRCQGCGHAFELLMRKTTVAACPKCRSEALERRLSLPAIKSETTHARAMDAAKRPSPRQKVTKAGGTDDSAVALIEQLSATGQGTPSRVAARGEAVRFLDRALAALPRDYERVVQPVVAKLAAEPDPFDRR